MDTKLQGRVVLITGGSSGIGRAAAVAFGTEGAHVALTYHQNKEQAEQTASAVREAGGSAMTAAMSLNDDASITAAVECVSREWQDIDVLINNAVQWGEALPGGSSLFENVASEEWRKMLRSNLEGTYRMTQAVLPYMRGRPWGRIANISSNLAEDGLPGAGPYAAAKAGIHGLTRVLAKELAPAGILCNTVLPGMTLTERAAHAVPAEVREQVADETPTGRLTTPEEVARLLVFLGSPANGHVNGEAIRLAGGL